MAALSKWDIVKIRFALYCHYCGTCQEENKPNDCPGRSLMQKLGQKVDCDVD